MNVFIISAMLASHGPHLARGRIRIEIQNIERMNRIHKDMKRLRAWGVFCAEVLVLLRYFGFFICRYILYTIPSLNKIAFPLLSFSYYYVIRNIMKL